MIEPLRAGDAGPHQGVIVDVQHLDGERVYIEVVAYTGHSLGKYEVHIYTRGPRGGLRYLQRAVSTDELRRAVHVRLQAIDATRRYVAEVLAAAEARP